MTKVTVSARQFDKAVRFAIKACGANDCPVLAHVLVEAKGGELGVIGCDGFRLHRTVVGVEGVVEDGQWMFHKKDLIEGLRAWKKVTRVLKGTMVEVVLGDEGRVTIGGVEAETGNWGVEDKGPYHYEKTTYPDHRGHYPQVKVYERDPIARKPNYPDWRQIWPTGELRSMVVDTGELKQVMKDAIATANGMYTHGVSPHCVVASQDDCLDVAVMGRNENVGVGSIEADGVLDTFGINAKYVLEGLYGVDNGRVMLRMDKVGHPVVLGDVAVIMPVHVGRR